MVREIPLTRGQVALVDDEDFERLNQFKWHVDPARDHTFYACRETPRPDSVKVYMHREILQVEPTSQVDHVDLNGLNNLRSNLRPATIAQNNRNVGLLKNNTSGFKGVSWETRSKRWKAAIAVDRRKKYLGLFRSPEDAAQAYDAAARTLFGEFARFNFPLPGERSAR